MTSSGTLTAILPTNDLDAAEAFYRRLGFVHRDGPDGYRMLSNDAGGYLHILQAVEEWLVPGRNPFALYLYREDVDTLAAEFKGETIERKGPGHKPWGMYEFSLNAPDDTLVRVGWPSDLIRAKG